MADEIYIQLEKEIGQQKKQLERVESKLDANVAQLRSEITKLRIDMRKMFDQLMIKMDLKNTGKTVVESEDEPKEIPSASQPNSTNSAASVKKLEDAEKEIRVSNTELADPKSDLISLKQTITVEKYHEEGAGIIVMAKTVFQTIYKPFVAGYNVGSIVNFCEKFKGVYSMVFVDMLVVVSDPYMFRLLVMGRRSLTPTISIAAASTLPIAFAFFSSCKYFHLSNTQSLHFLSSPPNRLGLTRTFTSPPVALHMDSLTSDHNPSQENGFLPDLLTEYMMDMKCEGCVNVVKNKLQTINGVKSVAVDLSNQVVRILGFWLVKSMTDVLEQIGRKDRLIGQGVLEDFLVSAVVFEFKGPNFFGVVRLAQVIMELARIAANFNGLSPEHSWSINEFGDLTRGAASIGKVFNPSNEGTDKEPLGDMKSMDVDKNGVAFYTDVKQQLRVSDLIRRSIVVYEIEDKSNPGLIALIIGTSLALFPQITDQPSAASTFESAENFTEIHDTQVSILLDLLKLIMERAVIIVDNLGRKSLPLGGVYGDHLVADKVYILEDKDVFEKGVLMHAHFKSSFLYGIRLMQSHLCMVVIDCNTICFSNWAVISCLKLVSNVEVIVG